ncbi:hypothetical protein C8Q78DRAFT_993233 [Trametes maxima]|nr:hypothetical protein C8Q78DRAFT_993233 [Trametes maxima]
MYDIDVSDTEYASVIVNFLPDSLSAFISQLSAQMKLQARLAPATADAATLASAERPVIEPDVMIELVLEEWERRRDEKRTKKPKDTGVAASAVSTEKPKWKGRGKGPQRPVGVCWNCGGKGHREAACPSPKSADASKGKGNAAPKPAAGAANVVVAAAHVEEIPDDRPYAGAWSAMPTRTFAMTVETDDESSSDDGDAWSSSGGSAYTELTEVSDADSMPTLQTVDDSLAGDNPEDDEL